MARKTSSIPKPDPKQDRAWRAVRAFHRLIPQLTQYARALTRNPRVEIRVTAAEPHTDGRVMWLRPPAKLGDNVKHEKFDCNKRNPTTLRQLCPACDIHEMIMAAMYHEMAHITFGTMVAPIRRGISAIRDLINEWHPTEACDHAKEIDQEIMRIVAKEDNTYLVHASVFDVQLSLLVNALEDARVNTSMFDARPGTRTMFAIHLRDIFTAGVDEDDEEDPENLWQNRDLDQQLLIGMFLAASEHHDELNMLSDEARKILWSEEVQEILVEVPHADSVHDVVRLATDIFRLLDRLGLVITPKCQVKENEDASDPGEPDDARDSKDPAAPADCQGPGAGSTAGGESSSQSEDDPTSDGSSSSGISSGPGTPGTAGAGESSSPGSGHSGVESNDIPGEDSDGAGNEDTTPAADDLGGNGDPDPSVGEGDAEMDSADSATGESRTPEEREQSLQELARVMTLHHMIQTNVDDAEVEKFASGKSMLGPGEELTGQQAVHLSGGWGDAGDLDDQGNVRQLLIAIQQALSFDTPSRAVHGVDVVTFPHARTGWYKNTMYPERSDPATFTPSQAVVGRVITEARLTFEENRRHRYETGLRSGKINTRTLSRAPLGDERLFRKRNKPGKKDYMVVLGFDMSGSTGSLANGKRDGQEELIIDRIKRAVFAQAEVLHALNIPFEIWGHSAGWDLEGNGDDGSKVWMFQVKTKDEAWGTETKVRLASVNHCNGNLDGHTLEFYRKRAELSQATDKIICYYTDGAMPAMNPIEEREILVREVKHCEKTGIHLIAVGIETSSPEKFGFDTVEVNDDLDLVKVVQQLKRSVTS